MKSVWVGSANVILMSITGMDSEAVAKARLGVARLPLTE